MNKVLIISATSDVGLALAHEFAKNGFSLILTARNTHKLNSIKLDLEIRYGISVILRALDLTEFNSHLDFYKSIKTEIIGVCIVAGFMVDQKDAQNNWSLTFNTINVNYTGIISLLNIISNDFEDNKKEGFIIGVSSVAGERGRKANYIYGSAKAGLTTYFSGLRQRFSSMPIQVITVKPGFIYTKMTANMKLPSTLTATPEEVARKIYNGYIQKRNVIYIKPIWYLIMLIVRHIPEFIFKKMSF